MASVISNIPHVAVNITTASGTSAAFLPPGATEGGFISVVAVGTWSSASVVVHLGSEDGGRYAPAENGTFTADIAKTLFVGRGCRAKIVWSGGGAGTDVDFDFIS